MAMSCDHSDLLPLEEALRRLWDALPATASPAIIADRDDPPSARAAMDGVALRAAEGRATRRLLGTLFAGDDPTPVRIEPGTCIRVMTGAALPFGADAIVPVEQLRVEGDLVQVLVDPEPGDHVRPRAEQAHAGDLLLPEGAPLTAARLALCAQVGLPADPPARILVAVASTGDELVPDPDSHQIRDSNGPMLAALAQRLGADAHRWPSLPDEPKALAAALQHHGKARILLTSGGVSAGEHDYLPTVLADLGATILFHKIRLKPGKPMLAATLGDLLVLALPGNPVSAYLNALIFLDHALARLEGRTAPNPWRRARLATAIKNKGERPLLQPCRLMDGELHTLSGKGSADLITLARADVCAWIEPGGMEAGVKTRYLPVL
jgi:molybdopterin molybdotransferase